MERFYKGMTYIGIYDGHGLCGKRAAELAKETIQKYIKGKKEILYAIKSEEEMAKFFKEMYIQVQEKFIADVKRWN